jgi:hypothetical protein
MAFSHVSLAVVWLATLALGAQQVPANCRTYYVGTVLYISCDGRPGQPAVIQPSPRVGLDPSIPLGVKPAPATSILDSLLKVEQIRALQQQTEAARQPGPAVGRDSKTTELPAGAMASPEAATPMPGAAINGEWWLMTQRQANNGDQRVRANRAFLIKGIIEGIDLSLMVGAESHDEYVARSRNTLRTDLTLDQVIAKIDGYYAEPSNLKIPLSIALLAAMKPQK